MFFVAFFFWPIATGLHIPQRLPQEGEIIVCETRPQLYCKHRVDFPGFPETKEEVDFICEVLEEHQACIMDYIKKCGKDNFHEGTSLYDSQIINSLCADDTPLYNAFVENSKCIGDVLEDLRRNETCQNIIRNKFDEDPDLLQKMIDFVGKDAEGDEKRHLIYCLDDALHIGCGVQQISSKCGFIAKGMAIQIIEQSNVLKDKCGDDHIPELEEALRRVGLSIKEEENTLELIFK